MKTIVKVSASFLLMILFPLLSNAQSLTGGIAAGIGTGSVRIEKIGQATTNVFEGHSITGFEAGIFVMGELGPLFVKPMAMYDYRYGDVSEMNGYTSGRTHFSMHKLQFPLLAGLHVLGPVYAEGGPVYNYILNVTEHYGENVQANIKSNGWGWRVGAGLDLKVLMLSLSYQGGAYGTSADNATFKEPNELIFGAALRWGSWNEKPSP